jgi:hypothetical protein
MKVIFWFFVIIISITNVYAEIFTKQVYLKPGTLIKRLNTKEEFLLEKGIFVSAKPTNESRTNYIIFDKSNQPLYLVEGISVVEFDKEVQMLPNVDAETTYPAPSIFKSFNQHAFFDTQFNVHLDNLQTSAFNNIPEGTSAASTIANRFEIRTLYNSSLPVNFGFAINYEFSSWTTETELEIKNTSLSILSLGPQLQHYVYEDDTFALSLIFGAEYAPIYRLSTDLQNDHYSGILLDLGAELLWGSDWGKWSLGAHFRRHDLTLNSTSNSGLYALPESIIVNSIGGMLGYKYEWDL